MKQRLTWLLMAGACLVALQACNKDNDHEQYWISLATVVPHATQVPGLNYELALDNGTGLNPVQSDVMSYVPKENQRALVWYNITGENDYHAPNKGYDIHVRHIRDLLTKDTIQLTAANADSIGNDPVRILNIWSGGDFMNIRFGYNYGSSTVHFINLVENTLVTPAADGKVYLEFRHNANGDTQQWGAKGLVCFRLKPYQLPGKDSVDFVIKVNDFTGDRTYTVTYNYASQSTALIQMDGMLDELDSSKFQ